MFAWNDAPGEGLFRATQETILGPRAFVAHLLGPNPISTVELVAIDVDKTQSESGTRLSYHK